MSVVLVQLPKALQEKLGEEATKELLDLINASGKAVRESVLETGADRFEKRLVEVKTELEKEIAAVKTELVKEIANVRADLTWKMFLFWAGQVGITLGSLTLFYQMLK